MINELVKKYKPNIAVLGDIIIFFFSIILTLYLRYGNKEFRAQFLVHIEPFIVVLIIWLIIFYIFNLYTYKAFKNTLEITRGFILALIVSFLVTITFFYIFSRFFNLTPKVNLVIFTVIFGGLDLLWRYTLRRIFIKEKYQYRILMLASSPLVEVVMEHVRANPQLGYYIDLFNTDIKTLPEFIRTNSINMIVIDGLALKNRTIAKTLYGLLPNQIEITMLTDFYESLFNCIPLDEIEEEWFIKEITENKNVYESIKRLIEIILSCLIIVVTIPLTIIIGITVALTSSSPIIYRQERIGKDNKPFTLYKFRTMKINNGPLWTEEKDDRVTYTGKFLRQTHLDEIPQLINVIKGDISFIGPRPECTGLVEIYSEIPYYEIRHMIKPGITGWAQLNYKASVSVDEAQKKFQFDLYYLKNRSFILDLFILLKTIRAVFQTDK